MVSTYLVVLPVAALLAGILLQLLLAKLLTPRDKGWIAVASSLVALGGILALWPANLQGQTIDFRLASWDGPIALAYHVDGLSLLFALMAAGIGTTVLVYSVAYMATDQAATRFYVLMLLFIGGLIHLVFCADLLLLYFSWEVIGLCSFFLVGFWYTQSEAAAGARKVLIMTHIAGYGLLAAILILFARTGSTLWTDPQVTAAFGSGLFALTLIAAVAKSVQFPLHTWIPDAMAAPTPVSALLHAACYVKAGVYLIARLHSLGPWPAGWHVTVIWIGSITMLVGVLYAMIQSDIKRLLAFHTVSQIGYMILGLGLGTPLGIAAGLLHCLNHGMFKGGLFLCSGAVQKATGTRDMDRLGGLATRMPATAALWLVSAGSIAGVPLLSGFVSKWLLYNAALETGHVIPALIAWIVSILTLFSFLKATSGVFLGEERSDLRQVREAPTAMLVGTLILAAGSVIVGVAPQLAVRYVINPLLPAMGSAPVIGVSWLGLSVAGGSWFATGGLVLALVAVGVGVLVYWLAQPRRQVVVAGTTPSVVGVGGVFSGGEPLAEPMRLSASDFSLIIKNNLAPFYTWLDVDRYYATLGKGLLWLSDSLERASTWLEQRAMPALVALVVLAAVVAGGLFSASGGTIPVTTLPQVSLAPGWLLPVGTGLALLGLLLAGLSTFQVRRTLLLVAPGLLAVLGLIVSQPMIRLALLELAALAAVATVWKTTARRSVPRVYLLIVLLSLGTTVLGIVTLNTAPPALVMALLLAGFALKLALIPLYVWLPLVAEATPALVVGMIVGVVDVAALGELITLRQSAAWLFAYPAPWLVLVLLSVVGGGLLMLTQRNLKRLLAFSTIEDVGCLLLGVTLGGELGLTGVVVGAAVHALAKSLLFTSLSVVEIEEGVVESRGLASRYPISGFGFVLGSLTVLGMPLTAGYVSHWRLYTTALQYSPILLVFLILGTALAVLAYARVIATRWWGADESPADRPDALPARREPRLLVAALVGMSVLLLLGSLWPNLWNG